MRTSDNHEQELAIRHLTLIEPVARRIHAQVRPLIDLDDLLGDGAIGLLRAAARFDPRRGVPFARFAAPYVRWAMLDGVRRWSWAPRTLFVTGPVTPRRMLAFARGANVIDGDDLIARLECALDARTLLETLPARWRAAVEMRFLHQSTLKQSARALGVTEARACQLLHKGLRRMRRNVEPPCRERKEQPRGRRDRGALHFSPHSGSIIDRTR